VELPRLNPLYEKYKDRGLEIVAVEGFRMEKLAKKFIEENQLKFKFVQDNEEDDAVVRKIYKVNGFPTTLVIDRSGKVFYSHLGFEAGDEENLEKEILSLM
jgi:peroxiredoxin